MVLKGQRSYGLSFTGTLNRLGVRLPRNNLLCRGATISPASARVLEKNLGTLRTSGLELELAPDMHFHELERILNDSRLLRLSLKIEKDHFAHGGLVRIGHPKGKEELERELKREFERFPLFGVKKLQELKELMKEEEFDQLLCKYALEARRAFKEEGIGSEEFDFLMDELCRLGDHELNLRVVAELKDTKAHDLYWIAEALRRFQEAFPEKIDYHRIAGDLYYDLCMQEGLYLYDVAIDAYKAVLTLAPKPSVPIVPRLKVHHAKTSKKRKKHGKGKKAARKQKDPTQERINRLQKLWETQRREHLTEKKQRLVRLWGGLSGDDKKAAFALVRIMNELGRDEFESVFRRSMDPPRQKLNKLDLLWEVSLEKEYDRAAEYFKFLGDELLGEVVTGLIKQRAFHDGERTGTRLVQGRLESELISGSWLMLKELLERDQIEWIKREAMENLLKAAKDNTHRYQGSAVYIMDKLIWQRKFEADRLYHKYIHQLDEGRPPDGSLLDRAITLIREARHYFPHYVLKANLAVLLTMKGEHLNSYASEKDGDPLAFFKEAIKEDPDCALALEKICQVENLRGNYAAVIEHASKILRKARDGGEMFAFQEHAAGEIAGKMETLSHGIITATHGHLGFASLKLYEQRRDPSLLKMAEENLTAARARYPQSELQYHLISVYLLTKRHEKAFELLDEYLRQIPRDKKNLFQVLQLSGSLWLNLRPGEAIPEKLLDLFVAYVVESVRKEGNTELGAMAVDFAAYLLDFGAFRQSKKVCGWFTRKENRGSDSFYYAHYVLALKAYRRGEFAAARGHLHEIINAPRVELNLYSGNLKTFSSLKANAFNMMVDIFRSIALDNGKDRSKRDRLLKTAMSYVKQALKDYPDDPVLLNTAGVIYEELRHKTRAEKSYRRAIEVAPQFANNYLSLIDLLLSRGRSFPEKREEANRVMAQLREWVAGILKAAGSDLQEIDPVGNVDFFLGLLELYCERRYQPALDILRSLLGEGAQADIQANLLKPFTFALVQFAMEIDKRNKKDPGSRKKEVPEEIKQLLPRRSVESVETSL